MNPSIMLLTIMVLHLPPSGYAAVTVAPAPSFSDPTVLVAWLIKNSGAGFNVMDETANAAVLTPGLRAALRVSLARSRQRNEPPCGANGDIILGTQEEGAAQNVRLSAEATAPDRQAVSASFDIVGSHRTLKYMTVLLDGAWKVENIISEGVSLRRSLDCKR